MDVNYSRLEKAKIVLEELINSKRYEFGGLKRSSFDDHLSAVYAIFDKVDGTCLYVGRTKDHKRRIYSEHLMGKEINARLKKYLKEDVERPDIPTIAAAKEYLLNQCYFQYYPVKDMRERGQIEGLLSYLLDVHYIPEEH